MIKNKKALLGKIISGFPVLILIVIILSAFIILSYGAYLIKKPTPEQSALTIPTINDLLLKTINIKMNDGSEKKMLIFDALQLSWIDHNDGISTTYFRPNTLTTTIANQLLDKINDCYTIDFPPIWRWSGWKLGVFKEGKPDRYSTLEKIKFKSNLLRTSRINPTMNNDIKYYYGPCPL